MAARAYLAFANAQTIPPSRVVSTVIAERRKQRFHHGRKHSVLPQTTQRRRRRSRLSPAKALGIAQSTQCLPPIQNCGTTTPAQQRRRRTGPDILPGARQSTSTITVTNPLKITLKVHTRSTLKVSPTRPNPKQTHRTRLQNHLHSPWPQERRSRRQVLARWPLDRKCVRRLHHQALGRADGEARTHARRPSCRRLHNSLVA